MQGKIIAEGAEAKIILQENLVIKDRVPKSYRLKEIDEKIRKHRTKTEKKLLEKACKIINAPNPFPLEEFSKIKMPFIKGKKLSETLNSFSLKDQKAICKLMGQEIAKLHTNDIMHGDLTTSNMILTPTGEIFFIDFGLGYISSKIEDKGIDLHLLKQALEARHFNNWEVLFAEFLKGYANYKDSNKVLERIKAIEKRGRYRG